MTPNRLAIILIVAALVAAGMLAWAVMKEAMKEPTERHAMTKKLPKTVFVYWREYENDDPGLVAVEKAENSLEGENGCVRIGKYQLVEQADVRSFPVIIRVKKQAAK